MKNLRELEVILTSRNTFGPLHQTSKINGSYGPGSFMTTGEKWKDSYTLYEQGLLEKPEIVKKK